MATLLVPFICLAFIGLGLSLMSHVCAVLALPQPLGDAAWGLHMGIFVVWFPAMLASNKLVRDGKRKGYWRAALRGCPSWMRWMMYGFFVYALVNFVVFISVLPRGQMPGPAPPVVFRGFSGHWMAFYSAALAILYSALIAGRIDHAQKCPKGHPLLPPDYYCDVCRIQVEGNATAEERRTD
jgi:hypothetical protein